ncbi:hypothetical protein RhiirA1_474420 [Rhizophagus irregularis]|uniref:Uncharacterized protein n=2 Tax=Rhizophagus irregularis TaxID=588596 RepID=A0A2N0QYP8_9GLOM|nr:hypothetical protein RirG_079400 [Rhizophagus irregularis DAOM 197198w]PKC56151.1 hypothetical protein RhiirA1_474420 [Rhizophagus irregularis]UZO06403.1 hypothetical protein OCT59_026727 [Rhizophagus irregularis]GBC16424.1 hypothetical protein RIR_jg32282.t1 [Rhizophagus irregularis DAOM 181602=DAOM 197198]
MLVYEIEDLSEYGITPTEYYINFRVILYSFRSWVNETRGLINTFTLIKYKELADIIRAYKVNRDIKIISTPSGYETMKMNKGKVQEIPVECPKTDIERK